MCGILAYLGSQDAFSFILEGLSLLQNRGYDSAGICTMSSSLLLHKFASRADKTGIELLKEVAARHTGHSIGIGHTRWATHGPKTDRNAHPHLDAKEQFAVVHNGIIENYMEIKERLQALGYIFRSQTDTEVVPHLLAHYYSLDMDVNVEQRVIRRALADLQGTWALCIMSTIEPDTLYLCKNGSPLVLSYNQDHLLVSSEQLPLSAYFTNFISLQDGDIVRITKQDGRIRFQHHYTNHVIENRVSETSCHPYPHWTIKEIQEQPTSLLRALNMGGRLLGADGVKLGGLDTHRDRLLTAEHMVLLGCGTSYHAGLIGAKMIQQLRCFSSVLALDASECTELDIPTGRTVFVLLSQSGETKDLHRCLPLIRAADHSVLSIVNVVGSLLAREADCGIYLNAGREVGVASTKSFTSQVVALSLLGMWYSQHRGTQSHMRSQMVTGLRSLSFQVDELLHQLQEPIKRMAQTYRETRHMFLLGRGMMKYVAEEGALKIKEIAYVHAEGYAGGSLKHGPFALIDPETVVILLAPNDDQFGKMVHAASEIHSRHARIVLITNPSTTGSYDPSLFEDILFLPSNSHFQTVLGILPLQLLAYELSVIKGYDPDFPRNLAKVVTVDG